MTSFDQAADRINAAVEKAEIGSDILFQVANGDVTTEVPTTSGPVPSIKKWYEENKTQINDPRVNDAILQYETYLEAEIAAQTLPDGQVVNVLDVQEQYNVQNGMLEFLEVLKFRKTILDFGGDSLSSDNASAFSSAAEYGLPVYIPTGSFSTSVRPGGLYFGDGVIVFNGETLSLDRSTAQRYDTTLVGGGFTRLNTVIGSSAAKSSPASAGALAVFGHRALENSISGGRKTAVGAGALCFNETGSYADAFGADAGYAGTYQDRNTWIGNNSGKWAGTKDPVLYEHDFFGTIANLYGMEVRWPTIRADLIGQPFSPLIVATSSNDNSTNTALGRNTLLHTVRSVSNVAVGYNASAHGFDLQNSVSVGESALRDGVAASYSVAVGSTAATETQSAEGTTAIGFAAGKSNVHSRYNTMLGYRAGEFFDPASLTAPDTSNTGPRRNTFLGADAGRNATGGSFNLGAGSSALLNVSGSNNTAIGSGAYQALTTGARNTAVGQEAGNAQTTATNCVFMGYRAGAANNGNQNVMAGVGSGEFHVSGAGSTYLGDSSGRLNTDGSNNTGKVNATCLGSGSRVSGDNQVQLGASSATTYAYGAVQDRSDARDKSDVRDTVLGLDFINDLRAVDFKWDMRDDYVQTNEDGTATILPKDGSKKRSRYHHGVIAQELREVMEKHGVDFGGLQDHAKNGGCDVLSVGYTELIAPLIKAVQQLSARVVELESK